jgi:hypothetical protein
MAKTLTAPTRAELCELRDQANEQRIGAEKAYACLLAEARAADAEEARFAADHIPPNEIHPAAEYFPEGSRGAMRHGGTVRYHQAPAPERIEAARQAMDDAVAEWETVQRRLRETPEDDPVAAAEAAGCRYVAGRAFDYGPKHWYRGEPVRPEDLPGITGKRLNALITARTIVDTRPFAHLYGGGA